MSFFILFLFLLGLPSWAEEKLELKLVVTGVPQTSKRFMSESFSQEALPFWGVILGSTALLSHYD